MLQVNKQDRVNEAKAFEAVRDKIPAFADVLFTQDTRKTALFDFVGKGPDGTINVEVKTRNISATQFPDFFISEDKIQHMQDHPSEGHYIVYWFTSGDIVRVYNLALCNLTKKVLNFMHSRTGRPTTSVVYCVPSHQHIYGGKL